MKYFLELKNFLELSPFCSFRKPGITWTDENGWRMVQDIRYKEDNGHVESISTEEDTEAFQKDAVSIADQLNNIQVGPVRRGRGRGRAVKYLKE